MPQMQALEPCPECKADKHHNCNGQTWDNQADTYGPCPCHEAQHTLHRVMPGAVPRTEAEDVEEDSPEVKAWLADTPIYASVKRDLPPPTHEPDYEMMAEDRKERGRPLVQ